MAIFFPLKAKGAFFEHHEFLIQKACQFYWFYIQNKWKNGTIEERQFDYRNNIPIWKKNILKINTPKNWWNNVTFRSRSRRPVFVPSAAKLSTPTPYNATCWSITATLSVNSAANDSWARKRLQSYLNFYTPGVSDQCEIWSK